MHLFVEKKEDENTHVSSEACSEKESAASILLEFKKIIIKKIKTVNVNHVKVELRHDSVVRETGKAKPLLILIPVLLPPAYECLLSTTFYIHTYV